MTVGVCDRETHWTQSDQEELLQVIVLVPFGVQSVPHCVCRVALSWTVHHHFSEGVWQPCKNTETTSSVDWNFEVWQQNPKYQSSNTTDALTLEMETVKKHVRLFVLFPHNIIIDYLQCIQKELRSFQIFTFCYVTAKILQNIIN